MYYKLAGINAFLGNKKKELKWLHEQENVSLTIDNSIVGTFTYDDFISYNPLFNNIKNEDEFKQIVERAQAKKAKIRAEVLEIVEASRE